MAFFNGQEITGMGATGLVNIDEELSLESENPVQNKVVTQEVLSIKDELFGIKTVGFTAFDFNTPDGMYILKRSGWLNIDLKKSESSSSRTKLGEFKDKTYVQVIKGSSNTKRIIIYGTVYDTVNSEDPSYYFPAIIITRDESGTKDTLRTLNGGLFYTKPEVDSTLNTIRNGLVGKKDSGGGEIFSNYSSNRALAPYASAEGNTTTAGSKGFSIVMSGSNTHTIKGYTEYVANQNGDTTRLIQVNDTFIIVAGTGECVQKGVVSKVVGNAITVSNLIEGLTPADMKETSSYYFMVIGKPLCGNVNCGSAAQAAGTYCASFANNARAVGYYTKAMAMNATAEGSWTEALGINSHAEGYKTRATKMTAHAEGWTTEALGNNSHAEGVLTKAISAQSHAEGWETKVTGTNSHAEGKGTIAEGNEQHVSGRYNKANKTALLIIGNGTGAEDDKRSNAFEVDKSGTATLPSLKDSNGNPDPTAIGTSEYSVATKAYVECFINSQLAGYSSVISGLDERITLLNTQIAQLTQRVAQLESEE